MHGHVELNFDDYLLQQLLGSGASGKVYRALQKPTGRTVAVKFLRKDVLANKNLVRRFIQEAAIVAGFNHPGIVGVHGIGRTPNGGLFLVQDWIDGPNLAQHCAANTPDWRMVARWVAEAASAVHHAHERNIIHCDLKPANLLLGSDGRIYITDFGLAYRLDEHIRHDVIAGTLGSMAPEQVDACWGTVGPTTDVYGLGAVLFELVVGQPPVKPGRPADMLTEIVIGTPHPPVKSICENLPDAFAAIVDRCLFKQPHHRFASAAAVAEELLAVSS